jgi:hypothetical protein
MPEVNVVGPDRQVWIAQRLAPGSDRQRGPEEDMGRISVGDAGRRRAGAATLPTPGRWPDATRHTAGQCDEWLRTEPQGPPAALRQPTAGNLPGPWREQSSSAGGLRGLHGARAKSQKEGSNPVLSVWLSEEQNFSVWGAQGRLSALSVSLCKSGLYGTFDGRAWRLTDKNGDFRPGQFVEFMTAEDSVLPPACRRRSPLHRAR